MATLVNEIVPFAELFENCATVQLPTVAQLLADAGVEVAVLGAAPEFSFLPGYRDWSATRPVYIEPAYDCVLASVGELKVAQLFEAVRILTHFRSDATVVLIHDPSVQKTVTRLFAWYNLQPRTVTHDGLSISSNWDF